MLALEPFREMMTLREAMDRLLQQSLVQPAGAISRLAPCDLCESGDAYLVCCLLPGVRPDDVNISATQNTLTISGQYGDLWQRVEEGQPGQPERSGSEQQQQQQQRQQAWTCYHRELGSGQFSRSLTFATAIQPEQVEATCEHGLLTLRIPKAAGARARQIPIRVGGGQQLPPGGQRR